jgi:hypothetical protein
MLQELYTPRAVMSHVGELEDGCGKWPNGTRDFLPAQALSYSPMIFSRMPPST